MLRRIFSFRRFGVIPETLAQGGLLLPECGAACERSAISIQQHDMRLHGLTTKRQQRLDLSSQSSETCPVEIGQRDVRLARGSFQGCLFMPN
jgi:hypothetical protein